MSLDQATREKLENTIRSHRVVLFMKGSKHFPQCGFSSTVVGILSKVGVPFETVNVLADPAVREGIKEYSSWPTIPQLYIDGEFVGGCDIVKDLFTSGSLQQLLGVAPEAPAAAPKVARKAPAVTITPAAIRAFQEAAEEGSDVLRLLIDPRFQVDLFFGPREAGDIEVKAGALSLFVEAASAPRAEGIVIDFVSGPHGSGFKIENPNEPPKVKPLSPREARAMLDAGALHLFDVRPDAERALAAIPQARSLDEEGQEALRSLPKDAPIALHCHHGVRSRRAGEGLLLEGFRNVYNVEGGIDAWSLSVDPSIPRY